MLVRSGLYSLKGFKALKDFVRAGIKSIGLVKEIVEIVDRLSEFGKEEGDIPVRLSGALRRLLAGRGRF